MTGVVELSLGGNHGCVRTSDGMARCWGQNGQGELGDGTTLNQLTPAMIYASPSISAGMWHSCGVQSDSTIKCSGQSWRARLGPARERRSEPAGAGDRLTSRGGGGHRAIAVAAGGVSCA